MSPVTTKLEFSTDPLSDSTPAWTNITQYLIAATWQSGVSREFDDPQAGGATFLLKNSQRRFEPEYAAGAYYPNIVPGRRFRLTIDGTQQGIYYAQDWKVEYPAGTTYSTTTVTCSDGFWRLALDRLGSLTPATASNYQDVITADSPLAYFPLAEPSGGTLEAAVGNSGSYKGGAVDHTKPNPVLGDGGYAAGFPNNSSTYARSKLEDTNVFNDAGVFTVEAVATLGASANATLATGPWITAQAEGIFNLTANIGTSGTRLRTSGGNNSFTGSPPSTGTHHYALTYDGTFAVFYIDGAAFGTIAISGNLSTPDANDFLYIGGPGHANVSGTGHIVSHVAFYDYALGAGQIASHAAAALSKGYAAQTSGTRIAALATDPLWSTAGIPAGTVTAAARFQTGQSALDEITETAKIEQPGSLFYFDDAGNPDYRALQDSQAVAAAFGELEVRYDSIQLVYNDELFNTSTVSGEGLDGATATNAASISGYGVRAQDSTGLIITSDSDAALLSQAIVDRFGTPMFRIDSITLNGSQPNAKTQILSREVGDTIRIKRRGEGGTAIDIITRILSKDKSVDTNGDLRCTWTLARGFNAALSGWRVGVAGYSEAGQTTVAG